MATVKIVKKVAGALAITLLDTEGLLPPKRVVIPHNRTEVGVMDRFVLDFFISPNNMHMLEVGIVQLGKGKEEFLEKYKNEGFISEDDYEKYMGLGGSTPPPNLPSENKVYSILKGGNTSRIKRLAKEAKSNPLVLDIVIAVAATNKGKLPGDVVDILEAELKMPFADAR